MDAVVLSTFREKHSTRLQGRRFSGKNLESINRMFWSTGTIEMCTNFCGFFLATVILVIFLSSESHAQNVQNTYAEGANGAIATGSQQAADAGLQMLKDGGNAVDAAVTTMLVQTVVEADLFCFGSEVPIIVYDSKRDVVEVIVGLGAAPQLATAEWFNENRKGVIQGRGDIANCNVPGTVGAFITALDRYGSKTFGQCAQGMLAVLRERAGSGPERTGGENGSSEGL